MSDKKSIEHLFNKALSKAGAHPPKGAKEDIRKKLVKEGLLKEDSSSKRFFLWPLAFQTEKGIDADGLVGSETWEAMWREPVTP